MVTKFGFVSTYPPTLCGLATFASALREALMQPGESTNGRNGAVIRLVDAVQAVSEDPAVVGDLVAGDPAGPLRAARLLEHSDVVIVQHEYGVFGGRDGNQVLALLEALTVPTVVVLHTVLSSPTAHQKYVLEEVARRADAVVIMTETARGRLAAGYAIDMNKVEVIPHGAPEARVNHSPLFGSGRPTVLTWGLIGPGKGIEWGIEAMASLTDLGLQYVVAGQTHPKVLLQEGEAYRDRLRTQVRALGLDEAVTFDSRYRTTVALAELVDVADIVLLPYDSTEQVTSGVLIEAVAAGKPVVATRFPHAIELLADGAGILVPQKDPASIATALRTLLTHREVGAGMTRAAVKSSPELMWPAVGARYRRLADELIRARVAA